MLKDLITDDLIFAIRNNFITRDEFEEMIDLFSIGYLLEINNFTLTLF